MAGRGFGKTRTGSEWCRTKAVTMPKSIGAIVARTHKDARKVMIEGPAGILACSPPDFRPEYSRSLGTLTWPNGTVAYVYTAEEPDELRGPQHHWLWADELAAWQYPEETWHMLQMGVRLPYPGVSPQICVTTTPRPIPQLRAIIKRRTTVVSTGNTYENRSNLPEDWFIELTEQYEGTRIGRQELYAEMLDDNPDALWRRAWFEDGGFRVRQAPELRRLEIGIDPATTARKKSNKTAIVCAGVHDFGPKAHGYVLEVIAERFTPAAWASAAVQIYDARKCQKILAEVNQGGDMVVDNIKRDAPHVHVEAVHQWRGKDAAHEPVAGLYERRRMHHVGSFPKLEDQAVLWSPNSGEESPDELDALSLVVTDLLLGSASGRGSNVGAFRQPGSERRM